MDSNDPVGEELDTYSAAVEKPAETTGEHSKSVEGPDSAMANPKESVAEMNSAVDEYSDAIPESDDAWRPSSGPPWA